MIFDLSKHASSPTDHDWEIFQKLFPYMGAFLYIHTTREAYLDDNAFRILHIQKEHANGLLSHDRFTQVMQDITRNPVARQNQVYQYNVGSEQIQLRLSFVERDAQSWMGFVQDITHYNDVFCPTYQDAGEYDPLTHLYHRSAFIRRTEQCMRECPGAGYLAILHVHGIEQIAQQYGYSQNDRCVIAISQALRSFSSPQVIIGMRSYKEFMVYVGGSAAEQAGTIFQRMRAAISGCVITDDFGEVLKIDASDALTISLGYSVRTAGSHDLDALINHANFSVFEAMNERKDICAFNKARYEADKTQFRELQLFRRLVSDNAFTYHFQPIVSAKTGEIFAFEILMRAGDLPLTATQILRIAEQNKRLYAVEHATLFNAMHAFTEHQEALSDKKLFINGIPDHLLTETDFDLLQTTYGELLENIVIEVTEQSDVDSDLVDTLKARCTTLGCQFAIDDYGAGYSNTSGLLLMMPDYVKIDRALISGIENDSKKQRLVSDIISFAHENGISVIAECVETRQELRTVIQLGADLVQGFYTSRPKPVLLRQISKTVQNEIISFNLETRTFASRSYTAKSDESVELIRLALEHYTDILIREQCLTIVGEAAHTSNMVLKIEDGLDCTLTLQDVNLRGVDSPSIQLGEMCSLTLVLEGTNTLEHIGIYVPEGSSITIVGDGDLTINTDRSNSFGIGNDLEHGYGNITLATGGRVTLNTNGEQCVGIGGGLNESGSRIRLLSGEISIITSGIAGICVGSREGNAQVEVSDCDLALTADAASAVGIGSFRGSVDIAVNARVDFRGTGNKSVGIGSLEKGVGSIDIRDASVSMAINARFCSAIGTIDGSINTVVDGANIALNCEGSEIAGIWDPKGAGSILLKDAELDMTMLAASVIDVGTRCGSVSTQGGRKSVRINP